MAEKKVKNLPQEELPENTVNSKVKFSIGRVAELLRKMEKPPFAVANKRRFCYVIREAVCDHDAKRRACNQRRSRCM